MEKRLETAYDHMTMPEDAARRIETALRQELLRKKSGRWSAAIPPKSQRSPWAAAAAAVCLMAVFIAGGRVLLRSQEAAEPIHSASASDPTAPLWQELSQAGIFFQYPASWTVSEQRGEDGGILRFQEGGSAVMTLVRGEGWITDLTMDQDAYQARLRDSDPDAVVQGIIKTTIDGLGANQLAYTTVVDGERREVALYETVAANVSYQFSFFDLASDPEGFQKTVEEVMASVRFDGGLPAVPNKETIAFLEKMCYYMPEWDGYASLDDGFWGQFLFASCTSPELAEDGTALTAAGPAEYLPEGLVKISRVSAEAYVRTAMGCELPEYAPTRAQWESGTSPLYYENGYYYISVSDFGAVGYSFQDWDLHVEAYDAYVIATFHRYDGDPSEVTAEITFTLYPADNENGFTVIGKQCQLSQAAALRQTAEAFAQAYFSGDRAAVQSFLADGFSAPVDVYPSGNAVQVVEIRGLSGEIDVQAASPLHVSVVFLESAEADSYTYLTIEAALQPEGWRVQSYSLEK